ncbi:MAG TPA: riboflavin kinase [Candidatus Limnocylindria bacterium]|nr:riboflavin kinase [Candidatus Limnocylindria bacterium]
MPDGMHPAAAMLSPGEPAPARRIAGVVMRGAGRGRMLGFPTANLAVARAALPDAGVYAGWVSIDGEPAARPAMVYVGSAPTFGPGCWRLEAHLLDFQGDLYGRLLGVTLAARVAAERTHDSAGELAATLARLAAETRRILEAS